MAVEINDFQLVIVLLIVLFRFGIAISVIFYFCRDYKMGQLVSVRVLPMLFLMAVFSALN